jgi:hypothetical protein
MPTIPVGVDGHHMYYEDSGPPGDSTDYSTVLVVHGTAYHGGKRSARWINQMTDIL